MVNIFSIIYSVTTSHCSTLQKVLNETDTPQNLKISLHITIVVPKLTLWVKSVDIQGHVLNIGVKRGFKLTIVYCFNLCFDSLS